MTCFAAKDSQRSGLYPLGIPDKRYGLIVSNYAAAKKPQRHPGKLEDASADVLKREKIMVVVVDSRSFNMATTPGGVRVRKRSWRAHTCHE